MDTHTSHIPKPEPSHLDTDGAEASQDLEDSSLIEANQSNSSQIGVHNRILSQPRGSRRQNGVNKPSRQKSMFTQQGTRKSEQAFTSPQQSPALGFTSPVFTSADDAASNKSAAECGLFSSSQNGPLHACYEQANDQSAEFVQPDCALLTKLLDSSQEGDVQKETSPATSPMFQEFNGYKGSATFHCSGDDALFAERTEQGHQRTENQKALDSWILEANEDDGGICASEDGCHTKEQQLDADREDNAHSAESASNTHEQYNTTTCEEDGSSESADNSNPGSTQSHVKDSASQNRYDQVFTPSECDENYCTPRANKGDDDGACVYEEFDQWKERPLSKGSNVSYNATFPFGITQVANGNPSQGFQESHASYSQSDEASEEQSSVHKTPPKSLSSQCRKYAHVLQNRLDPMVAVCSPEKMFGEHDVTQTSSRSSHMAEQPLTHQGASHSIKNAGSLENGAPFEKFSSSFQLENEGFHSSVPTSTEASHQLGTLLVDDPSTPVKFQSQSVPGTSFFHHGRPFSASPKQNAAPQYRYGLGLIDLEQSTPRARQVVPENPSLIRSGPSNADNEEADAAKTQQERTVESSSDDLFGSTPYPHSDAATLPCNKDALFSPVLSEQIEIAPDESSAKQLSVEEPSDIEQNVPNPRTRLLITMIYLCFIIAASTFCVSNSNFNNAGSMGLRNTSVLPDTENRFLSSGNNAEIYEEPTRAPVCPLLGKLLIHFHQCHPWAVTIEENDGEEDRTSPNKTVEEVVNHTAIDDVQFFSFAALVGLSPSPLLGLVKWLEWIGGWGCIYSLLTL